MGKKKQSSSRSKIRKVSADGKQTFVDRLSGLPDEVICRILSFLPTKKSVQTCILAKRWRSMWALVPCLDFDGDDYRGGSSMFLSSIILDLLHKGVNMTTFYLNHKGTNCFKVEFETWVLSLIAHNVRNMYICLNYQFNLPQSLFSCETLVHLWLSCCRVLIPMTVVEFPSLKKLQLEEVMYESDSSLPNLLSGCPVLEELILSFRMESSLVCCNISSPTLKRLDIYSDFEIFGNKWYEVKLNTPALTFLQLHDFVSNDFSPGVLTSIIEADVCFGAERGGDTDMYSRSVFEFVGTMYNVKCLRLSTCLVGVVDDSAFSAVLTTIKFHNLTNLVLEEAGWRFISFFLENAENLQVVDVRVVHGRIKYWMEPNQVPVCVSSHLRKVTIRGFGFKASEFELVRYLLRNAKVMKRMEIHLERGDGGELDDAVKRISNCSRGSEACELVFH